jgi:23S rRNA U2552 (ribose-2'-O)-methylase RlmE/FtsJ
MGHRRYVAKDMTTTSRAETDGPISVGEKFPSARVTGVDLSPIQPHWIPPNVDFIVDDIEDQWVHANDFDFAHFRFVHSIIRASRTALRNVLEYDPCPQPT